MKFKKHVVKPIRFVELWVFGQWKIKVYSISQGAEFVDDSFINIAKDIAANVVANQIPSSARHYHTAFLTIHTSPAFNQIIIDWWAEENELRHLVFKAEAHNPKDFKNITSSGEAFCVWELKVIGFERDAWMKYILNDDTPNFDGYHEASLNTKA